MPKEITIAWIDEHFSKDGDGAYVLDLSSQNLDDEQFEKIVELLYQMQEDENEKLNLLFKIDISDNHLTVIPESFIQFLVEFYPEPYFEVNISDNNLSIDGVLAIATLDSFSGFEVDYSFELVPPHCKAEEEHEAIRNFCYKLMYRSIEKNLMEQYGPEVDKLNLDVAVLTPLFNDAAEAALVVFKAWYGGNRAFALQLAKQAAVEEPRGDIRKQLRANLMWNLNLRDSQSNYARVPPKDYYVPPEKRRRVPR